MVTVGVTGIGTGDAGADPAGVSHALTPSPAPGTERLAAEEDRSAWPGMEMVSRGGDLGGRAGGRRGRGDDDDASGWESADCGLDA